MRTTIKFSNKPRIISSASVVGKKEKEGPLGSYFDMHDPTDKFGRKTFEQAESEMQRLALNLAMSKIKLGREDIDAVFAGDLMNQCTGSSYGLAGFGIPFFGLYGACSTAAEALMLSAITVDKGVFSTVSAVASSHNSSAERQFRFPLEYGSQRPPTAQWTATAAASFIVSQKGESNVCLTEALPGRIIDKGITDASNMGAAMAPAAADTLLRYFSDEHHSPEDFDLILTGDLGYEGHSICREILKNEGLDLGERYNDCGILIYDRESQDTHSGGSGCGCSASVTASYIMENFRTGKFRNVLLIGTGALMSPSSVQQGLSIAGIGHLVRISSK